MASLAVLRLWGGGLRVLWSLKSDDLVCLWLFDSGFGSLVVCGLRFPRLC